MSGVPTGDGIFIPEFRGIVSLISPSSCQLSGDEMSCLYFYAKEPRKPCCLGTDRGAAEGLSRGMRFNHALCPISSLMLFSGRGTHRGGLRPLGSWPN